MSTIKKLSIIFIIGSFIFSVCRPAQAFWPWEKKAKAQDQSSTKPVTPEASSAPELTLEQAYRLARIQSETVAMKMEELNVAQGHLYQALDIVMPKVNFVMTRQEQDASKDVGAGAEGVGGTFTRRTTPENKFTFSQPIFSGFKEFAMIQASGAEKSQKRFEIRRAEETLFINVVEAFYNLAQAAKEVGIRESTETTLEKRILELKDRVALGRSRESEIETARAELKVTEAELVDARRFEVVSRQLLEFYIGRQLTESLEEEGQSLLPVYEESDLSGLADKRSDGRAAYEAYRIKEKNVAAAQADLFPEVKLDGNYYTERVGFRSGIDWDYTLTVDVPLFEGTETFGNIKVAASEREKEKYNYLLTKRNAELEIQNEFEEYRSAVERAKAYEEAFQALERSYEIQEKDYRLNLVSNLDVLDALQNLQGIHIDANVSDTDAKRRYWFLRVSLGDAPEFVSGKKNKP